MKYSVHFKKDGAVIAGEIDARDYADCRAAEYSCALARSYQLFNH